MNRSKLGQVFAAVCRLSLWEPHTLVRPANLKEEPLDSTHAEILEACRLLRKSRLVFDFNDVDMTLSPDVGRLLHEVLDAACQWHEAEWKRDESRAGLRSHLFGRVEQLRAFIDAELDAAAGEHAG